MTRFFLSILLTCGALLSCQTPNLLRDKYRPFYSESNTWTVQDGKHLLTQRICYNRPGVIDEEFCEVFTCSVPDSAAFRNKKVIQVERDTAIVALRYGRYSVWNWSDERNQLTGTLELLRWTPEELLLREKIIIHDFRRNERKKLAGKRKFRLETARKQ